MVGSLYHSRSICSSLIMSLFNILDIGPNYTFTYLKDNCLAELCSMVHTQSRYIAQTPAPVSRQPIRPQKPS